MVAGLHFVHQRRRDVTELLAGLRVGGAVRHQGRDDHLGGVYPERHLELLQQTQVVLLGR